MELNELLKFCLLALANRYPGSVVKINEEVLGHPSFWKDGCTPAEALELLQANVPKILDTPAHIHQVDGEGCVIYLVNRLQEIPAFRCIVKGYSQPIERILEERAA